MNKFVVNCTTLKLSMLFNDQEYEFDLKEGDVGDFWHSFTDINGVERDINFYWESEDEIPSLTVYDLKEQGDFMVVDMAKSTPVDDGFLILGNSQDYFN